MDSQALETGGMVVIGLGLIEIIKLLIAKRTNGKSKQTAPECQRVFPDEQKEQIRRLYDLHCNFDNDGVPLWFIPRSWIETQKEMAELMKDISQSQGSMAEVMQTLLERLEGILEKLKEVN